MAEAEPPTPFEILPDDDEEDMPMTQRGTPEPQQAEPLVAQRAAFIHDRRGFETAISVSIALFPVSFLLLNFYSWKLGLALAVLNGFALAALETVSSAPPNNGRRFTLFARRHRAGRKPVLLCLGDSLTHGKCSTDFTMQIPIRLSQRLGLSEVPKAQPFQDPLWVLNAGQNLITSHTVLERVEATLSCHPDYLLLMIGTNDCRGMYKKSWSQHVTRVNQLPEEPSLEALERNLRAILDSIRRGSPHTRIALATLPPMGENLQSRSNKVIKDANEVISRVAGDCTVLPVFATMAERIATKRWKWSLPVSMAIPVGLLQNLLYHSLPMKWSFLSAFFGHAVLTDGIHLNEVGATIVADLTAEWLIQENVAAALVES